MTANIETLATMIKQWADDAQGTGGEVRLYPHEAQDLAAWLAARGVRALSLDAITDDKCPHCRTTLIHAYQCPGCGVPVMCMSPDANAAGRAARAAGAP